MSALRGDLTLTLADIAGICHGLVAQIPLLVSVDTAMLAPGVNRRRILHLNLDASLVGVFPWLVLMQ